MTNSDTGEAADCEVPTTMRLSVIPMQHNGYTFCQVCCLDHVKLACNMLHAHAQLLQVWCRVTQYWMVTEELSAPYVFPEAFNRLGKEYLVDGIASRLGISLRSRLLVGQEIAAEKARSYTCRWWHTLGGLT